MDLNDLIVFSEIYEEKNISKAAGRLFLSPQGCSKIIQKLEHELGVPLFERSCHGVIPTCYGDIVYHQSAVIIRAMENIRMGIDEESARTKPLYVLSTSGMMDYLTRDFFSDFKAAFPEIDLHFLESSDYVIKQKLHEDKSLIGIVGGPVDPASFSSVPFSVHHPCLVINKSNKLAKKTTIDYHDLDGESIAIISRYYTSHYFVMNQLRINNANPDIFAEASEINYCHKLASQNKAVALSFDFAAFDNIQQDTVVRPFSDRGFIWKTYMVFQSMDRLSPQAKVFFDYAQKWIGQNRSSLFRWPDEYSEYNFGPTDELPP